MSLLCSQDGGSGENMALLLRLYRFPLRGGGGGGGSDLVQLAIALPMSSNPLSHVYVAVSPLKAELPVIVTAP